MLHLKTKPVRRHKYPANRKSVQPDAKAQKRLALLAKIETMTVEGATEAEIRATVKLSDDLIRRIRNESRPLICACGFRYDHRHECVYKIINKFRIGRKYLPAKFRHMEFNMPLSTLNKDELTANDAFFVEAVESGWLTVNLNGNVTNNHTGRTIGSIDSNGYHKITLSKGRTLIKHILTHRLVWLVHGGNIPAGMVVSFKGDTKDHAFENLQLKTVSEVAQAHARTGERPGNAAFDDGQVKRMRQYFTDKKRFPLLKVAQEMGIHPVTVYDMLIGRTYAEIDGAHSFNLVQGSRRSKYLKLLSTVPAKRKSIDTEKRQERVVELLKQKHDAVEISKLMQLHISSVYRIMRSISKAKTPPIRRLALA